MIRATRRLQSPMPVPAISAASFVFTLARLTVREGLRARLPWLAAVVIAAGFGLALLLTRGSIIEAVEVRSTLVAALLRVAAVFIMVLFVVSSVAREAGDKLTDLLLSQPMPRWAYVLGKLSGFLLISLAMATALALPLWVMGTHGGVITWGFSLWCELAVVSTIALFFALSFTQPAIAISAAAAFYLLSRSMRSLELIASASLEPPSHSTADAMVAAIMHGIGLILPALDRFTLSSWLVTPPLAGEVPALALQAVL